MKVRVKIAELGTPRMINKSSVRDSFADLISRNTAEARSVSTGQMASSP